MKRTLAHVLGYRKGVDMARLLAVAAAGALVFASPALADGPVHIKRTFPATLDFAAGEACNFTYHGEGLYKQDIKQFFDDAGNLVFVINHTELRWVHMNVDTGYTLTEVDHYTVHLDLVTGEITSTGNDWHLRDVDGKIVLVGAGRYVQDLITGEILSETPNVGADTFQVICPALGGAPAQ